MDSQAAVLPAINPLSPAAPGQSRMDPKTRFYRHFQEQATSLQEQVSQLGSIALVGGERQDAIESVQAGIAYLTKEVADASDYAPPYDQRTYNKALKELTELLNEELTRLSPKARFQFKQRGLSTPDVKSDPRHLRRTVSGGDKASIGGETTVGSGHAVDEEDSVGALPKFAGATTKNYNEELARPGGGAIRKPSFSAARDIVISDHSGLHIILPLTAAKATSSGRLTNLTWCIVDMSAPAAGSAAFANLTLRNISRSLIIAGKVNGAAHVTDVRDSVVVVTSRQVRVHNCKNCDFYVAVPSNPIIEDCSGVRFAPLPVRYVRLNEESAAEGGAMEDDKNLWDQVDDFKWLKSEPSPNWAVLPEADRIPEEVWTKTVPGGPGVGTDDILRKVGVSGT